MTNNAWIGKPCCTANALSVLFAPLDMGKGGVLACANRAACEFAAPQSGPGRSTRLTIFGRLPAVPRYEEARSAARRRLGPAHGRKGRAHSGHPQRGLPPGGQPSRAAEASRATYAQRTVGFDGEGGRPGKCRWWRRVRRRGSPPLTARRIVRLLRRKTARVGGGQGRSKRPPYRRGGAFRRGARRAFKELYELLRNTP